MSPLNHKRPTSSLVPPGVNFINVLRAAFTHVDTKSAKKQSSCQSFSRFWDVHAEKLLVEHWGKLTPIVYEAKTWQLKERRFSIVKFYK